MLLPHVACGVELLLSSSGNLKNKPWSTRCCSVLFPRGFCGSTDRKRSFWLGDPICPYGAVWLGTQRVALCKAVSLVFPMLWGHQISSYFWRGVAPERKPTWESWGSSRQVCFGSNCKEMWVSPTWKAQNGVRGQTWQPVVLTLWWGPPRFNLR